MTLRLLGFMLSFSALATTALAQTPFICGTEQARQNAIARDPHVLDREAALEAYTQGMLQDLESYRDGDTTVYIIPIVFHVLHNQGPENISTEQILDQVDILNRDYRRLNADTAGICCGFHAADIRLEFRLATIDPAGLCTNGIQRIRTVETYVGDDGSKLYPWYRYRYLNVWTVADMENGVAGYAYYPSAAEGALTLADGVIIRHDYVGSIGTSNTGSSRALTHEVGHYLNLQHVWGSTNDPGVACGDDAVDDTPMTKGWNFCPTPAASQVCNDTVYENFQNYMDYSYCSLMFSEGQGDRMRIALQSSSASRSTLWQPSNLAGAGVDGNTDLHCAPQAGFYSEDRLICAGSSANFHDNSVNAIPTSWSWSFQDGTPATSTDQNPTVTFSDYGWKTVTLTVGNADGSTTFTDPYSIHVAPGWPELPSDQLAQDFEGDDSFNNWIADNVEANGSHWDRVTNAGHNSNSSLRLNAFNQYGPNDFIIDEGANDIDELVTPTMDLTFGSGMALTFWHAFAAQGTDLSELTDKLEVFISTNCGRTWTPRQTIDGTDLVNNGATAAPFLAGSGATWTQHTVLISSGFAQHNVRFKFKFTSSAFANNLFLDDVNITGNVGIDELANGTGLALIPNPASSTVSVQYALPTTAALSFTLEDVSGRVVMQKDLGLASEGTYSFDPLAEGLTKGIYLARLEWGGGRAAERLVIE